VSPPSVSSRVVTVEAGRLQRWVEGFGAHHGGDLSVVVTPAGLLLGASDGASAQLAAPFSPWAAGSAVADDPVAALAVAICEPRRVALLLVRRGGYGCALVVDGRVESSKVGTRYVQSRTAAGGWSQQRFARRRHEDPQRDIGAVALRILVPALPLDGLATGGDRPLVERVLADPRLAGLAALPPGPHLAVGDPRADVVRAAAASLACVRITLTLTPLP